MEASGVEINKELKVQPGDKFTLIDAEGEEFFITGEDDPLMIELASAVDGVICARGVDQQSFDRAFGVLKTRFDDLPQRVKARLSGFVLLPSGAVDL